MDLEKERMNGVTLQDCFNVFTKAEELDDYKCDHCDTVGKATCRIQISRVPDILIIHLKRFEFS